MPIRALQLITAMVLAAFLLLTQPAQAQGNLRAPNPTEQKVLEHYRDTIHSVLESMDSNDWDTNTDFDVDDNVLVGANPDVPLDVDELIQRSYAVKKDSPLYQREVAPFLAKMQQMTPLQMAQEGKKLKRLRLEVQVHFNRAAADRDAKTKPQLQVPGALYSFMTEESEDKRSQTVVLLFGDWKSAQQRSDDLKFHFKHPAHMPFIENVEIQLQGSPDRIKEVLRSVDWKKVNEALTTGA